MTSFFKMALLRGDMLSTGGGGFGAMRGADGRLDGGRGEGRGDGRGDGRVEGRGEGKDEVRTQFMTREGTYRLLPLSEYARPNRVQPNGSNNTPVRVSFIKTPLVSSSGGAGGTLVRGGPTPLNTNGAGATIGSPNGANGGSSLANGGIYVGWGGAPGIGSPNGPSSGVYSGSGGWATGLVNSAGGDMGGGPTNWNGGVQGTSWGGGSTLGNGAGSSWNGGALSASDTALEDKICFNVGKELYVYNYNGIHKAVDLSRPIDKRLYRGTSPTCHDFNTVTCRADRAMLVIGFTAGQVQLIDPIGKEISRLYNEERHIDKSRVTCVRWLPDSPNQFLVSHASGQLYVYHEDLPCGGTAPPTYQLFKLGDGFSVHTCKTRSTRNPLYRWLIDGAPPVNEFAFSPCSRYLALACGDGFLRVYDYDRLELVGSMKSYFGGLLCVAWSPDGRYVVTGGEDDLVTVWSFADRRVVCRGRGHTSWVSVVAFDPYATTGGAAAAGSAGDDDFDMSGSDEEVGGAKKQGRFVGQGTVKAGMETGAKGAVTVDVEGKKCDGASRGDAALQPTSYRFGSVGQDTVLCLWDLTEDVLRRPTGVAGGARGQRTSVVVSSPSPPVTTTATPPATVTASLTNHRPHNQTPPVADSNGRHDASGASSATSSASSLSRKYASLSLSNADDLSTPSGAKHHRHSNSLSSAKSESAKTSARAAASLSAKAGAVVAAGARLSEAALLLGTPACPGLHDVPLLEPLTRKRVAHERLSALVFRADCVVTACQEGNVYTWSRPGGVAGAGSGGTPTTTPTPRRDSEPGS